MKSKFLQSGFSLITAIFLLVVLATLMVYMINLRVVQQNTVVMSLQGARAMQAARSGIEYGIYKVLGPGATYGSAAVWCATPGTVTFTVAEPALQPFTVTMECSKSDHVEAAVTVTSYNISALATNGSFALGADANPDYISRKIRVTVSIEPP